MTYDQAGNILSHETTVTIEGTNTVSRTDFQYDARGNAESIRALAHDVPWLRIVPAGDELYTAVGRPTKIPTVLVFDHGGALLAHFDRAKRGPPSPDDLAALLR